MRAVASLLRFESLGRRVPRVSRAGSRDASRPVRALAQRFSKRSYASSALYGDSSWVLALAGAGSVAAVAWYLFDQDPASASTVVVPNGPFANAGKVNESLPTYSREEVSQHKTPATGIWVIYKDGVYDITEFVEEHPGGKARIMLAAGGSIEPFWALYQQHVSDEVATILESKRVGNVALADRLSSSLAVSGKKDPNDPYGNEPARHPALLARMQKPFNAETPPVLLTESLLTPNDLFYVRNHLPVPNVDAKTYVLEIAIEGRAEPLRLSLNDLKHNFPKYEVDVTIQCAGNRRTDLNKVKEVRGLAWDVGAIGTAKWGGAKLRDVLKAAGLDVEDDALMSKLQHVHFEGLDRDFEKSYTASIPIEKATARHGDCILAYEMNGAPIPRDHGYPVRAIVPGIVGARNVKWLGKVKAAPLENEGHWQQNDYKGFSPNVDWGNVDYKGAPAIQDLPVQSAITIPSPGTVLDEGSDEVNVKGYAWAGGGRGIVRVDVSADGGKTWTTADLLKPDQQLTRTWAWTIFNATVPLPPAEQVCQGKQGARYELICKAVDSSYNVQPDTTAPIWNLRGVLSTSWHRIPIYVPKPSDL